MHNLAALEAAPPISPAPPREPERLEVPRPVVAVVERRRVVIRLANGDEIAIGDAVTRDEALQRARGIVELLATAEADAEWPEIEGRFLRPSSIVSVDVLIEG